MVEVPPAIGVAIADIADAPSYGARLRRLRERVRGSYPVTADEIVAAELAGIAMDPSASEFFNNALDRFFNSNANLPVRGSAPREVVIGGGYHAAVYCSVRVALGFPKPIVIEADKIGGAFAVSRKPSFFLNSELTDGAPGYPWDGGGNNLNWLPGAPVQPAQLTGRELPDNAVMRFAVRAALAFNGRVRFGKVTRIKPALDGSLIVETDDGLANYSASRVIDTRGLGPDKAKSSPTGRIMSWTDAMGQMDRDFPFDKMSRVAVVGGGKSGFCAVEALLGIGPDTSMRAVGAGMPKVDLYGLATPKRRSDWLAQVRTRYARLASHLPDGTARVHDLTVHQEMAYPVEVPDGVLINGRFYDRVIMCTGHEKPPRLPGTGSLFPFTGPTDQPIAKKAEDMGYYQVGPVAGLPWSLRDEQAEITSNPDNKVSLFRLVPLTVTLASTLSAV